MLVLICSCIGLYAVNVNRKFSPKPFSSVKAVVGSRSVQMESRYRQKVGIRSCINSGRLPKTWRSVSGS